MLSKEIEKCNIPVVLITAMTPLAKQVGANRIVRGVRIPHPWGDPSLPEEHNKFIRERMFLAALNLLKVEITEDHYISKLEGVIN